RHDDGDATVGVGVDGRPKEMIEADVLEPYGVFDSALDGAVEVVSTILRIDGVFAAARGEHTDESRTTIGADTGGYPWAIGH
ncbi:MAG: thermosome subunit alpha, partial [Halorubrum sp.]